MKKPNPRANLKQRILEDLQARPTPATPRLYTEAEVRAALLRAALCPMVFRDEVLESILARLRLGEVRR